MLEKIKAIVETLINAVKGLLARLGLDLGDDNVDAGFTL